MNINIARNSSNARKLVHISKICQLHISKSLIDLSKKDFIDNSELKTKSHICQTAAQFMIDSNLRCGLFNLTDDLNIDFILFVLAKIAKETSITIVSQHYYKSRIGDIIGDYPEFKEVQIISDVMCLNQKHKEGFLNGVLIVSNWHHHNNTYLQLIAKEFPKTIFICDEKLKKSGHKMLDLVDKDIELDWLEMGFCLFPHLKSKLYFQSFRSRDDIWTKKRQNDLAIFYNIFLPEYVKMNIYCSEEIYKCSEENL